MILYHFTTVAALGVTTPGEYAVEDIWPDGILPSDAFEVGLSTPVVWLTADPEPGAAALGAHSRCVRFRVRIPSTDRKLVPCEKFMVQTFGRDTYASTMEDTIRRRPDWRRPRPWWVYRAPIPVSQITGLDVVDGVPWWLDEEC